MTPAATWQGGPKFGREHLRHLSVYIATAGEERDELLGGVASVHEESEKTAVLATDVAGQALQLSLVIFPKWCSCVIGKLGYWVLLELCHMNRYSMHSKSRV